MKRLLRLLWLTVKLRGIERARWVMDYEDEERVRFPR